MNESAQLLIRLSISLLMIAYGISQVIKPGSWFNYIPPWLARLLPMQTSTFMREHGAGNIALGLLFMLNVRPEWVYWLVLAWWLSILPFVFYENWQSGLRDVVIIAGIIALITAVVI